MKGWRKNPRLDQNPLTQTMTLAAQHSESKKDRNPDILDTNNMTVHAAQMHLLVSPNSMYFLFSCLDDSSNHETMQKHSSDSYSYMLNNKSKRKHFWPPHPKSREDLVIYPSMLLMQSSHGLTSTNEKSIP